MQLSGPMDKSLQAAEVGDGLDLQCEDERLNMQRDKGLTTYKDRTLTHNL